MSVIIYERSAKAIVQRQSEEGSAGGKTRPEQGADERADIRCGSGVVPQTWTRGYDHKADFETCRHCGGDALQLFQDQGRSRALLLPEGNTRFDRVVPGRGTPAKGV